VTDPTRRRSPGSWPRDHPVRWRALGWNISTFVVTTMAVVVQFVLIVPLLMVPSTGDGSLQVVVALVWAGATLWATWCWITAQSRAIIAPIVTGAVIWLAIEAG
jgi:hypothetical protein